MANRTLLVNQLRSAKRSAQILASRVGSKEEDYPAVAESIDAALLAIGESTADHIGPAASVRATTPVNPGKARFGTTPPNLLVSAAQAEKIEKNVVASAEPAADADDTEKVGEATNEARQEVPNTDPLSNDGKIEVAVTQEVAATAAAEREAAEAGIDLATIEGHGQDGQVLVGDVRDAVAEAEEAEEAAAAETRLEGAIAAGQITEQEMSAELLNEIAGTKNGPLLDRLGNIETVQALTTKLGGTPDPDKSPSQQATLLKKAAKAKLGN